MGVFERHLGGDLHVVALFRVVRRQLRAPVNGSQPPAGAEIRARRAPAPPPPKPDMNSLRMSSALKAPPPRAWVPAPRAAEIEAGEFRTAVGVDLAAVEPGALVLVGQEVIGRRHLGEFRLGVGVVLFWSG